MRGRRAIPLSRRALLRLAGAGLLSVPCAGSAQQAGRTYRIGVLNEAPRSQPQFAALFDELGREGYVEGKNLATDPLGFNAAEASMERIAADYAKRGVDAVLAFGDAAIRAMQRATAITPIVAIADDLVGGRLVASLARPGGNTTGISILAPELDGKRQEILMEAFPGIRRIAVLAAPSRAEQVHALEAAARPQGVTLSTHLAGDREEIARAIEAAKAEGAAAINVLASPVLNRYRSFIIERVARARLPAIYQWPEYVRDGALLAYGPSFNDVFRQAARLLARVLKGTKAGDLPVEQPTTFALAINLRTATALGVAIPPSLLSRADEVIE